MISKIDIKDYEKAMQEGKYEDVYKDVVEKSMELVKEIGKIKDFEFPEDEEGTELYYSIKFYFDKMEPIVQLERFKTNDFDSTNALFTAIRVFCHNNQSMLIEVSDISDKINKDLLINNKEEYSKFKEFLDSLEPQENAFEIDKSEPDFGYSVALFDEEDALSKVDGYSVQDDTELCK